MTGTNVNDTLVDELVTDYVCYYLHKNGFNIQVNGVTAHREPSSKHIKESLRTLCDEFEQRYESNFNELCMQLEAEIHECAGVQESYIAVVNGLFAEGITWARIVVMFALTGGLSLRFVTLGQRHLVKTVVESTCLYIKSYLNHWIDDHNGWNGLVEFNEGHPDKQFPSPWPTLKNFFCGIAAGALGALTIGAIVSSKT